MIETDDVICLIKAIVGTMFVVSAVYAIRSIADYQKAGERRITGAPIPPLQRIPPDPHATKRCEYCGNLALGTGKTCTGCGAPVHRRPVSPPPPPKYTPSTITIQG